MHKALADLSIGSNDVVSKNLLVNAKNLYVNDFIDKETFEDLLTKITKRKRGVIR